MNENETLGRPRRGRPKGALNKRTIFAREWAEKLGLADPCEFLIRVMNADTIEVTKADANGNAVLDADGKPVKQLAVVPLATRIQCAAELMSFVYPRLQATQVQAQLDTAVSVDLDVTKLLADPEAAKAAQDLALKLAAIEGAEYRAERGLPAPALTADHPDYSR